MRRARKTDPAFIAQGHAKTGMVTQVPSDRVTINIQSSSTGILINIVAGDLKVKWRLLSAAEIQSFQRESLDEALRLATRGEPCCPNLNRHPARVSSAATSPGIHQQITEPPCAAAVWQSHSNKPNFI